MGKGKELVLLQGAIDHWKRMLDNPWCGDKPEAKDCALCGEFLNQTECKGCPVCITHQNPYCQGTPYWYAVDCFDALGWTVNAETLSAWKFAAEEEIKFLERVRTVVLKDEKRS